MKLVNQQFELVAFCTTSLFCNVHSFYRNGIQDGVQIYEIIYGNLLILFRYIADFSVANGCKLFVEQYGSQIIEKNLTRNFIVHLNNLLEFQVIPQSSITKAVETLFKMKVNLSGKKM